MMKSLIPRMVMANSLAVTTVERGRVVYQSVPIVSSIMNGSDYGCQAFLGHVQHFRQAGGDQLRAGDVMAALRPGPDLVLGGAE